VLYIQCNGWYWCGILWNGSEEAGNVRGVTKMKALTVTIKTVTLIGKGG